MAVLDVKGICKTFDKNTVVLRGIDFSLEKGESVAIIGSSGSGKTTLLRCLNFLTTPDEGKILVNGETLFDADDPATQKESEIRRKRLHFGLVFQNFNLFPQYTALQNVMLASELLAKEQPDYHAHKKELHEEIRQNAEKLLKDVGTSILTSSPAGSSSESQLRARWRSNPTFSASMSRRPRSTPSLRARCCASSGRSLSRR